MWNLEGGGGGGGGISILGFTNVPFLGYHFSVRIPELGLKICNKFLYQGQFLLWFSKVETLFSYFPSKL